MQTSCQLYTKEHFPMKSYLNSDLIIQENAFEIAIAKWRPFCSDLNDNIWQTEGHSC